MHRKIKFALAIALCLFLIPSVFALDSWVKNNAESYGDWISENRVNWESAETFDNAQLWYDYTPSNPFTLWDLRVKNDIIITGLGDISHVVDFIFGNEADYVQIEILWHKTVYSWFFGLFQGTTFTTDVYVSKLDNYSNPEHVWGTASNVILRVVMFRRNTTTLTVKLVAFVNPDDVNGIWSFARNYTLAENVFSNGYLTQIMLKGMNSGRGKVKGQIWDEALICDGSTISDIETEGVSGFWEGIAKEIWNSLTNAWNGLTSWPSEHLGFLGDLYRYLSFGMTFIVGLFNTATKFLPLFLMGYLLFLLGLIITCVVQWNPDPLFNHFVSLYTFFVQLISMIVNIADTIWSYIKFW